MLHARYVAALTEFWRCHREAAGVLHFCGLGYSRPGDKPRPEGGATCDDFIDLEKLTFEPHFEEYVREAFNPVGPDARLLGRGSRRRQPTRSSRCTSSTTSITIGAARCGCGSCEANNEVAAQSQDCKVGALRAADRSHSTARFRRSRATTRSSPNYPTATASPCAASADFQGESEM